MEWIAETDLRSSGVRLFCLPHAGSGAAGFYRWKRLLPASIAVCPVQLPGRERRFGEAPLESARAIASELLLATRSVLAEPYAIFGHSMGALLAYEFARQVAEQNLPAPHWLFASARESPQLAPSHRELHLLNDDSFLVELRERFGGAQDELMANPELRELFLPVLRADLKVVETYEFAAGKLTCPVAAFAGVDDASVTEVALSAWAALTSAGTVVERFAGDHYFHFGAGQAALLSAIAGLLPAR